MTQMSELIKRLDATRKVLMSGDGEWSDAETMDSCVTEAIVYIKQLEAERDSAIRGREIANNDLEVFQGILKRVEAERDALEAENERIKAIISAFVTGGTPQ